MINDKMSNSKTQEIQSMSPELRVLAENVAQDLLPSKSKKYYEAAYEKFVEWKKNDKAITSENCHLVYFNEMAKKFKSGFKLFPRVFKIVYLLFPFGGFAPPPLRPPRHLNRMIYCMIYYYWKRN